MRWNMGLNTSAMLQSASRRPDQCRPRMCCLYLVYGTSRAMLIQKDLLFLRIVFCCEHAMFWTQNFTLSIANCYWYVVFDWKLRQFCVLQSPLLVLWTNKDPCSGRSHQSQHLLSCKGPVWKVPPYSSSVRCTLKRSETYLVFSLR